MAELNVGADPINPAYYAGTACAEIIEHMPANVSFAAKYAWRLGEKDSEAQEAGKAIWYLKRQLDLNYLTGFIDTRQPFVQHYMDRINNAFLSGKLDPRRARIVELCCKYTLTGSNEYLNTCIQEFEFYL